MQRVFFAGGGVGGERVSGASDPLGAYPSSKPQKPENMAATIYHALGIPATAAWPPRVARANGKAPRLMKDVLPGMLKAHEIQAVLALENSFNRVGLDHVVLVKVASTAGVANMIGCT